MKRIKILDSCRGLAALIVVFHHLYTRFGYLYPQENSMAIHGVLNFISQLNGEAVLFFFILSGFSIRLSLRKGLPVRKESLNEYLYRRFKRILPLYFLALLVTFIAGLIIHQTFKPDYSIRNLIGNLFFLCYSVFFVADFYLKKVIRFDANFLVMVLFCLLRGGLMTFGRSDSLVQLLEGVTMLTVFYILRAIGRNFSRRFLARTEKT